MPSSALNTDAAAFDAAERLSGERIATLDSLRRTGNNRVYRVRTANATYALKAYAGGAAGAERLRREYDALLLLNPRGIARDVPRPVGVDRAAGYALYDWIEGTAVSAHDERDVDAALAFLQRAHTLRTAAGADTLLDAAEACTSGAALFAGLTHRLERLRAATSGDAGAAAFVTGELAPELYRQSTECEAALVASGIAFGQVLPKPARTLSPSDFSFHNALRRTDGTLVFLDFEYFGWDDPVKLTSDFLWHPATRLSTTQTGRFRRCVTRMYAANDTNFERRFQAYFPVFGLKWCMIVLNEFCADDWDRRRFSGQRRSHTDVKAAQLTKARRLFEEVRARTKEGVVW